MKTTNNKAVLIACSGKKAKSVIAEWRRRKRREILGYGWLDNRGYHKVTRNGKQVYVHRIVLEAKLGRPLKIKEVAHHINGNKMDNQPENLEILSQPEHIQLHKIRRLLKSLPVLKLASKSS